MIRFLERRGRLVEIDVVRPMTRRQASIATRLERRFGGLP